MAQSHCLTPVVCGVRRVLGLQENASKRDDVPPSQGGKYVGFGSGPPPAAPRRGGQAGGIDDVSVALSKGFSQLTTVAGETMLQSSCPLP